MLKDYVNIKHNKKNHLHSLMKFTSFWLLYSFKPMELPSCVQDPNFNRQSWVSIGHRLRLSLQYDLKVPGGTHRTSEKKI